MCPCLPSHMENQKLPIFLFDLYTTVELTLLDFLDQINRPLVTTSYMADRKVAMSHMDCPSAIASPCEIHPYFAPAAHKDPQLVDH